MLAGFMLVVLKFLLYSHSVSLWCN